MTSSHLVLPVPDQTFLFALRYYLPGDHSIAKWIASHSSTARCSTQQGVTDRRARLSVLLTKDTTKPEKVMLIFLHLPPFTLRQG